MKPHYDAFKALLTAITLLSGRVYGTVRLASGDPVRDNYVVLYPDSPADLDDERYTARQQVTSTARYRYDVRVVAVDVDGMLRFADAVMSVIGQTPIVAGRKCDPVSLVPAVEEGKGRFDSVSGLHYVDMSFEFVSRRA